jgi:hypothetical protein
MQGIENILSKTQTVVMLAQMLGGQNEAYFFGNLKRKNVVCFVENLTHHAWIFTTETQKARFPDLVEYKNLLEVRQTMKKYLKK